MTSRTGREDNFLRILFHEPLDNPSQAGPLVLRDALLQTVDRPGGSGEPRPGRRLDEWLCEERSSTLERSEVRYVGGRIDCVCVDDRRERPLYQRLLALPGS